MTIETSVLNNSAVLPTSDQGYVGSSGDGNSFTLHDLEQGFLNDPPPPQIPTFLPQNADDGENYVGDPYDRGGFAGRPMGFER